MEWIYDNFRNVGMWTKLMLKEKRQTLSEWMETMRKETTPGDDMCLYLLARMYNKHVYVHNKLLYWCTAIHKIKSEIDLDLIQDCPIELVFVRPWIFGEVKKVRIPKGISPTSSTSQNTSEKDKIVITENDKSGELTATKDCSVVLTSQKNSQDSNVSTKLTKPQDANVTPPSHLKQPATRHTSRKRTVTDYKKLADYTDDDTVKHIVKRKKPTNLLRKPSRYRQKIERTRRRNKQNKSSNRTSDSRSTASGNVGTSPPSTISDSISPEAQPLGILNKSLVTTTEPEIDALDNAPANNQANTSTCTSKSTVLIPASK